MGDPDGLHIVLTPETPAAQIHIPTLPDRNYNMLRKFGIHGYP